MLTHCDPHALDHCFDRLMLRQSLLRMKLRRKSQFHICQPLQSQRLDQLTGTEHQRFFILQNRDRQLKACQKLVQTAVVAADDNPLTELFQRAVRGDQLAVLS